MTEIGIDGIATRAFSANECRQGSAEAVEAEKLGGKVPVKRRPDSTPPSSPLQ